MGIDIVAINQKRPIAHLLAIVARSEQLLEMTDHLKTVRTEHEPVLSEVEGSKYERFGFVAGLSRGSDVPKPAG